MTSPQDDRPLCLREAAPLLRLRDPRECPAARAGACCEGDPDCAARSRGFDLLTRAPEDVVLLVASDGRIVDASARAVEVYGFAPDELSGTNLRELRPESTAPDLELQLALIRRDGALRYETVHRRSDGTLFPVEVSARTLALRNGVYVLLLVRDASARRAAEQAAALAERKFEAAFQASGVAMVLVGVDGRILDDNVAARALMGLDSLVGLSAVDLSHPATRGLVVDGLREYRDGLATRRSSERRFVRPDGQAVDVLVHASAVRDADDRCRFVVAVLEDVTEKKRLEAQLARTERLLSLGTLAAGVAHEVNNPLAYVIANLNYAVDEVAGGDPELRAALAEALEGARRVEAIVADLRAFARGEDVTATTPDLPDAIRSAVSVAQSAVSRRARLRVEVPDLPPVRGAKSRLCQVFVNLLLNAAQALDEARGGHEVSVTAGVDDGVWVEVADTGVGIAPEHRARIFDPFFTTKPIGVGSGLGLFVSHGIVTRVGGRIEARPRDGGGTIVRVELPVADEARAATG